MYKRRTQLLAIMLMLALCFTTASMAFAQRTGGMSNPMGNIGNGGNGHGAGHGVGAQQGRRPITVKGTVVAVDTDLSTLTVNVTHANRARTALVGQDVAFSVEPDTLLRVMGFGPATLEDVLEDDVVKVMAKSVNGDYVAYKIMVY